MLYTHDVTCNLSRWNNEVNDIYKKKSIKTKTFWKNSFYERNAQFVFLCNPPKSSVNVCIMKIFKNSGTNKVIACCKNSGEESF